MTLSFEDFLAQLAEPDALARLRETLRTPEQREALRRCAAVREFDRPFFDRVIAPSLKKEQLKPPRFRDVIELTDVERTGVDRWGVREREQFMRTWLDEPVLLRFRNAAAQFCRRSGEEWEGEHLRQLFALRDPTAARVFEEAWQAASGSFDLGRCERLLESAYEFYSHLEASTRELIDLRRAELRARSYWKDDYYKTLVYLPRPDVDGRLQELLTKEGPWIRNLFAKGGCGKTAAIRNLIARFCVPRRIPVGRVDFGFTSPFSRPTTLLLQFVQQFEEQVPGTIFNELRKELTEYESTTSGAVRYDDPLVRIFVNRFASTVREVRGSDPSLLIFDNMEDALLGAVDVPGLLALFASAHAEAPSLRLLLSGRYSLFEPERVEGIEAFRGEIVDQEIEPFTEEEASRYLIDRRGLEAGPGIDRIVKSAGGLPFKLSLYADVLRDDPSVSIDELVSEGSVELAYLIVRIVRRVDARLQWVLRYGVVPQRLTRAFFEDVMSRYLPPAMSGRSTLDDPTRGLSVPLQANVFPQDALSEHEQLELDALWVSLHRYAAEHSWVSADRSQPDTLVFHDEVRRPMRKLLRQNDPIFHELHAAAALHFDVSGEPAESVYHRFQIGDPRAEACWRDALASARAEGRREDVLALTRALLTEDFLEGLRPVRTADGKALVRRELLIEASLLEALASVGIGRVTDSSHRAWRDAAAAVRRARALRAGPPASVLLALIDTALFVNSGRVDQALELVENLPAGYREQALSIELLRGQVYALARKPSASIKAMRRAKALATAEGMLSARPSQHLLEWPASMIEPLIVGTLADQCATEGHYDQAMAELKEAMERARAAKRRDLLSTFALRLTKLQLDVGLAAAALQTLDAVSGDAFRVRAQVLRARATLLRFEPLQALEICNAAEQAARKLGATGDYGLLAEIAETRAEIHAAMTEIVEARACFDLAVSNWREASQRDSRYRDRPAECLITWAAVELREFHDRARAESLLAQCEQVVAPDNRPSLFALALLRDRSITPPPATALQAAESAIVRRNRVELVRVLRAITPGHARLTAVAAICNHRAPAFSGSDMRAIMDAVPDPRSRGAEWDGIEKDDRARLALLMAEICAAFDRSSEARAQMEWGFKRLFARDRPLLDRLRLDLEHRLGLKHRSRRTDTARWRKLLGDRHPDFLSVLLFGEARTQRTEAAARQLHAEARERVRSSEVRSWLARQSSSDGEEPVPLGIAVHERQQMLSIVAREGRDGLEVTTTLPDGRMRSSTSGQQFLFGDRFRRRNEIVSYDAVKMLAGNPRAFAHDMLRVLLDEEALALLTDLPPLDVELMIAEPVLQAFPWELALSVAPARFRSVYRTAPPRAPGRPQPLSQTKLRVLIVRRSERTSLLLQRGVPPLPNLRFEEAAGRIVSRTHVLEDPTSEEFLSVVGEFQPDLIHISATLSEPPSLGGVYLEFSSRELESYSGAPQSLSARLVQHAVRETSRRPVLILDATAPRSHTEAIRQIFLRNVFAAELFFSGEFGAVVATGGVLSTHEDLTRVFVDGFSLGLQLGDIVRRLREAARKDIGREASALFSYTAETSE